MKGSEQDYLTVIGGNLLMPITKLLEALKLSGVRSVNEVQTSPFENGYSVAIILLAVIYLESTINRIKYIISSESGEDEGQGIKTLKLFRSEFPNSGLDNKLEELFVIRDVIAHNHIWEATIRWDENYELKLIGANKLKGYGDKKYKKVIDRNTRKTKLLGINLFPTRICWSDIVTVLKTVVEILMFLEGKDRRYSYISNAYVEFNEETPRFVDIVDDLV
jgi:hypothetical protein